MDSAKGLIYAGITAFLWGILAVVLKIALQFFDPVTIVWFRFLTAFTLLFIWALIFKRNYLRILIKPPFRLILTAIFLGINYLGFISGVHYTSPGTAQVFIQLGPLILALSGIFIFKEKVTLWQVIGIVMVFSGLTIFYSEQIQHMISGAQSFNKGVIWVIGGAIAWSVYAVQQKKLVKNHDANQLNLFIYGLPALLYIPMISLTPSQPVPAWGWALIFFLGLNTLIAYGSLTLALKYADASKISVIITLNPIITFAIMAFISFADITWMQHETFTWAGIFGATLVLSGAAITIAMSGIKKRKSGRNNS